MRTVNEVSKLAGVSIRTLHYYDRIGLLPPSGITETGYRLYDDTALERLQCILLFRELQFPLKDIKKIMDSPGFDKDKALEQQITLLELKKEHLENLIELARDVKRNGVKKLDFKAFDTKKMDEYAKEAKARWGETAAYKEYEEKCKDWDEKDAQKVNEEFMSLFTEFARLSDLAPEEERVQKQVRKLQDYITDHFYTCTKEILSGLGQMYAAGGEMTENIDRSAGKKGTAELVSKAISVYCSNN